MFALNDAEFVSVYPKADKQHYNRFLLELLNVSTGGKWPKASVSSKRIPNQGGKELLFFLTDLYEHDVEISSFIKSLKSAKNEVVVIQLMGASEMDFNYGNNIVFEDLETGARVKVDSQSIKAQYLLNLNQKIEKIKEVLLSKGIEHHIFRMDQHLGEALPLFLKQRKNSR